MNKKLQDEAKKLNLEVEQMEEVEYGLKELIHGILIGLVIGFIIAWIIL